jgi:RNA polymerase sigma factor (sigma-70 family)
VQKLAGSKEDEWSGLMRLALVGDQPAYQRLLSAIAPHLRALARRVLPHTSDTDIEDIVQETLLAVHLKRGTWDRSRTFLPWLNAVARHKAIDAVRRRGRRTDIEIDVVIEHLAAPASDGTSSLDAATVLASLDPRDRAIVEQIYLQESNAIEVGARLGMSEGAVRVALHRALRVLSSRFNGPTS